MNTFIGFLKDIEAIIEWLARTLHWSQAEIPATPAPAPAPVPPPAAPVAPTMPHPTDKVRLCALAQQDFEGWFLPGSTHDGIHYPEGSSSYKRNNPGNIKGLDDKFLTFPTYEEGLARLELYIRNVALGKNGNYPPGCTITGYTHVYTGDAEPAPTNYAAAIARATGLPITAPMASLLT